MIIDAFMFFNELDILEIRLNELDSVVDKFVIVESLEHHGSENIKPAILAENWNVVRPFEHKIKYEVLPRLEPKFDGKPTTWLRENFHRRSLEAAYAEFVKPTDIVMVSDCDEIPRASVIQANKKSLDRNIHVFRQDFFYYNVNNCLGTWNGTVVASQARVMQEGGLQELRNRRDGFEKIANGGWHFSYFGGIERIRNKVANFAHSHDPICTDLMSRGIEELRADVAAKNDLYRREGEAHREPRRESNDRRLPEYFLNNRDRFAYLTDQESGRL